MSTSMIYLFEQRCNGCCVSSTRELLQARVHHISSLLDDHRRPVEDTLEIAIALSGQCCCIALILSKQTMSLGLSGLRGVHEVTRSMMRQ